MSAFDFELTGLNRSILNIFGVIAPATYIPLSGASYSIDITLAEPVMLEEGFPATRLEVFVQTADLQSEPQRGDRIIIGTQEYIFHGIRADLGLATWLTVEKVR
jgi:hypothetical protein